MKSKNILPTLLIVLGFGVSIYFLVTGIECAVGFTNNGKALSDCYSSFHVGTAIFIAGLIVGVLGLSLGEWD